MFVELLCVYSNIKEHFNILELFYLIDSLFVVGMKMMRRRDDDVAFF
jgi:hypothetical protein